MKPTWQELTIEQPDNAAVELQRFIESHVNSQSGIYNLVYKVGNLKSMVQFDFLAGRIYHYNFNHHPATQPLKEGIKATFPQMDMDKNFIDISGKQRTQLAQDPNVNNYQIKEAPLTKPSEAITKIIEARKEMKGFMYGNKQISQNALTINPTLPAQTLSKKN